MFWKKSKDKDKSKNTTTTIYRTDGGITSSGSAITSFESKYKSSANSSSSKTKITISSSQTISQKQQFSSQVTRSVRELGPTSGGSAFSLMDSSSKWTNSGSGSSVSQLKQKAILPPRQKTEPSIVRRIDATPFSTKYESPYRNANLPTLRTPLLPGGASSTVTTVTTTYQSPYRATSATSSMREKKTSSSSSSSLVPAGIRNINTTSTGLFSSSPKTKTSSTSIWNPMSSMENIRPTSNPTWNKVNISQPKLSSNITSPAFKSSLPPKTTNNNTSTYPAVTFTSNPSQPSTSLLKPSPLPPKTTSAAPVVVIKKKQSPGVVHIFHNDKFDSPDKEFRIGSIEDVRILKKTFQAFKMQVNLYENRTVKQVEDIVRKIELKDYANASCIVVVILTHGTRYETVAAKDGSYSIDDTVLFPILRNRSLRSKPKLLFIQACKGSMEPGKFHKDAIQPNGPPDEILKCYSTFEGYVAYRTEKGSLFIQSLCELLQTHGKSKNIKDIMDMVIRSVKIKSGSVQIPSYETTLTEPYVFGDFI